MKYNKTRHFSNNFKYEGGLATFFPSQMLLNYGSTPVYLSKVWKFENILGKSVHFLLISAIMTQSHINIELSHSAQQFS